ncbi:MAG: hypothetical protein H6Q89_2347 [Myxococcaceae bacterium]|nr:hypothetical protein [Myxococcaceae bacterium]
MFKNLKNTLSSFDRDDVLESLGLERKHTTAEQVMPALAIFGAGVLVGVGLGMIFAPRTGAEIRGQLQSQFKRVEQKVRGNGGVQPSASAPIVNRPA